MRTTLLFLLFAASLSAQTVSLTAGGGYGALNNTWKRGAAVWSAGVIVDNPVGQHGGSMLGLHYRQRADKNTRLHTVQADFAAQYIGTRIRAGAGGFFAVGAGTESDLEPAQKLGSGVGVSAFVGYRLWRGVSVRVVYDHGLTDLSDSQNTVKAHGLYALIKFRL